jgi:anti-sigma factor RsiW
MRGDDTVNDAQLLRYVHGDMDDAERANIEALIARNPASAGRVATLQRRSARLTDLLGTLDPDPDVVTASAHAIRPVVDASIVTHVHWWRRTPPALRAAAAITLVLGGVLLVEPVRAWVVDQARAIGATIGIGGDDQGTVPADAQPTDADVSYAFPWSSAVFGIDAGSTAGTIIVVRDTGSSVVADMTDAADASFTVMPTGLRIDGRGSEAAVYTLSLPPVVTTIRVRWDGATRDHAVPAEGPLRVPLR